MLLLVLISKSVTSADLESVGQGHHCRWSATVLSKKSNTNPIGESSMGSEGKSNNNSKAATGRLTHHMLTILRPIKFTLE